MTVCIPDGIHILANVRALLLPSLVLPLLLLPPPNSMIIKLRSSDDDTNRVDPHPLPGSKHKDVTGR